MIKNDNTVVMITNCNYFAKVTSIPLEEGSYFIGYSYINAKDNNKLKFIIQINNVTYIDSNFNITMNEPFTVDYLVKGKGSFKFSPTCLKL